MDEQREETQSEEKEGAEERPLQDLEVTEDQKDAVKGGAASPQLKEVDP